jgi:exosortase
MDRLNGNIIQRWLVPSACATVFFLVLAFAIPYSASLGEIKVSLARLIWGLCHFGSNAAQHNQIDYTYCLLVPVIFVYLVYLRRDELARAPIRGSNLALGIIAAGVFFYWFGIRAENQYFGYAALQILLAGVILWLWGWPVFRLLLFPWAFFLFAWPLPFLDPIIAVPLRIEMSDLAAKILPLIGIPTVQNGVSLLSGPDPVRGLMIGDRFQIDIADGCSGIRSLFALLMFSALFGYLFLPRLWQQWVVFLSAFPLAVVGNLARVLILVVASITFGSAFAIGTTENPSWFHEACGFAIYAVALGLEFVLASLLTRSWKRAVKETDAPASSSP